MEKLRNKIAVITGGNSGIGLATAQLFAHHGARVIITGRNQQTLYNAVSKIGNGAIGVASNTSDLHQIEKLYQQVSDTLGKIDVLVINAGIYTTSSLGDYTEEMFDQTIDINFKGVFFSVQKALPHLNDGASIILTGSTVSDKGLPNIAAYAATKAAVRSLARSFSAELLKRQIRVNVLSPGPVDTPVFERNGANEQEIEVAKANMAHATPVKRLGTTEEMAQGFLYLASDESKYMVGGELLLDGGLRTL